MLRKKIALVVGAGDFLGASIAKKFAKEGFLVVVTRRRGDLTKLVTSIVSLGGEAIPFYTDARNENQVIELIKNIETKLGQIDILIYNVDLDKEIKNLVIYKKGLFNSNSATEAELLDIFKPLLKLPG